MSLIRRAGAEILKLLSRSADPAAVADQFQVYSKLDAGIAQLFGRASDGTVYQITPPSSGGGVINELWAPRATPHAADDEFDANALDAAWSQTGLTALDFANRPAPYVNPVVTNRASWENLRDPDNTSAGALAINSWLRFQPAAGLGGLWKPLDSAAFGGVVPATLLCWARVRFGWLNAQTPAAGEFDFNLTFFEEGGGGYTPAVHATISLVNTSQGTANTVKPMFWGRNGAAVSVVSEGDQWNDPANDEDQHPFFSGYVGLQKKSGTNYVAWVIDDGGRLYMGEYVDAGLTTINAMAITGSAADNAAGACMYDVDFVRFYEGVDWIP